VPHINWTGFHYSYKEIISARIPKFANYQPFQTRLYREGSNDEALSELDEDDEIAEGLSNGEAGDLEVSQPTILMRDHQETDVSSPSGACDTIKKESA
jgi:hypothetical protein